jgi:hypothetical protein
LTSAADQRKGAVRVQEVVCVNLPGRRKSTDWPDVGERRAYHQRGFDPVGVRPSANGRITGDIHHPTGVEGGWVEVRCYVRAGRAAELRKAIRQVTGASSRILQRKVSRHMLSGTFLDDGAEWRQVF